MGLQLAILPQWQGKRLLVRVYSCLSKDIEGQALHGTTIDLGQVLLSLQFTDFDYFEVAMAVPYLAADGLPRIDADHQERRAPKAPYLALVTVDDDEFRAGQRLDWAAGVVRSLWGQNAVVGPQAEFWHEADGKTTVSGPIVENPLVNEPPKFSKRILDETSRRLAGLSKLDAAVARRLETSMRWYLRATRRPGVDAVISLWTAFESLAASDDPLDELEELACRAYGITDPKPLGLGLLHGFRSAIVHNGWIGGAHAEVMDYYERHWENLHWFAAAGVTTKAPSSQGRNIDALVEIRRLCKLAGR